MKWIENNSRKNKKQPMRGAEAPCKPSQVRIRTTGGGSDGTAAGMWIAQGLSFRRQRSSYLSALAMQEDRSDYDYVEQCAEAKKRVNRLVKSHRLYIDLEWYTIRMPFKKPREQ
jgi:hypothetical protein